MIHTISLASTIWLGTLLIYTGSLKLTSYRFSVSTVRGYELLPHGFDSAVGLALPWVELGLGFALLAGIELEWVGLAAAGLAACFVLGAAGIMARSRRVNCGCAGRRGNTVGYQTIGRAALMVGAAASCVSAPHGPVGGETVAFTLMFAGLVPSMVLWMRHRVDRMAVA